MSTVGDHPTENAGLCFLIFLKMAPGKTLSPDVLGLHAAHLSELDWLMSNHQNGYRPDQQQEHQK